MVTFGPLGHFEHGTHLPVSVISAVHAFYLELKVRENQGAPKAREAKRANVQKLRFDADFENEATKCMVLLVLVHKANGGAIVRWKEGRHKVEQRYSPIQNKLRERASMAYWNLILASVE